MVPELLWPPPRLGALAGGCEEGPVGCCELGAGEVGVDVAGVGLDCC